MVEVAFLVLIGAGFAGLVLKRRVSERRWRQLGSTIGATFSRSGVPQPADFERTALYAIADGGKESHVLSSHAMAGPHNVAVTTFEFEFARAVRGTWGYLQTKPPFRLYGPATVIAVELPFRKPHVLVKRPGAADRIIDDPSILTRSMAASAREVLLPERHEAASAPALGNSEVEFDALPDHRVYAESAHVATTVLDDAVTEALATDVARTDDLIVEIAGNLLLLYRASEAKLGQHSVLALQRFGVDLVTRLSPLETSPRGVGHR